MAHLSLARLALLLRHGAGDLLGDEVALLLRDIVALLPGNLPAVVPGNFLAELLRGVGADLTRHLDVVADLARHLLALHTLAVRADGVSFLALHSPWNILALGGRNTFAHLLGYLVALLGRNILALLRWDIRADFLLDIRALLVKLRPAVLNWRLLTYILALLLVVLGGAHLVAALLVLGCALLAGYGLALLLGNVNAGAGGDSGALALADSVTNILELRPTLLHELGAALVVVFQIRHGLDDVLTGGVRYSVALLLRGSHTLLLGVKFRVAFFLERG